MSIIYFIVLIIIAFIALGLWFRSGEDLTAWDQPPEPAACDFFSRPGGFPGVG